MSCWVSKSKKFQSLSHSITDLLLNTPYNSHHNKVRMRLMRPNANAAVMRPSLCPCHILSHVSAKEILCNDFFCIYFSQTHIAKRPYNLIMRNPLVCTYMLLKRRSVDIVLIKFRWNALHAKYHTSLLSKPDFIFKIIFLCKEPELHCFTCKLDLRVMKRESGGLGGEELFPFRMYEQIILRHSLFITILSLAV